MFHSRRMNAYFKHAGAQELLARRDGRVVGRISAQVDGAYDAQHGPGAGMFGFLELEDDAEVARALIDAAQAWLAERGRHHMIGPMDYTMNDECGVLIGGFEREPMIKQPWHPPHYQSLCEAAGLTKAIDLWMWELVIDDREKILPIIFELAEQCETKHGVQLRHMRRRDLAKEIKVFGEVYNAAWKRNWGFVPYSEPDLEHLAEELQLVFDKHWFMLAQKDGETIGIAITLPDINQVLKKMNGACCPSAGGTSCAGAGSSTASASASSASSPSTSTPARPRVSTSSTSTWRRSARKNGARWAGSSRPTAR